MGASDRFARDAAGNRTTRSDPRWIPDHDPDATVVAAAHAPTQPMARERSASPDAQATVRFDPDATRRFDPDATRVSPPRPRPAARPAVFDPDATVVRAATARPMPAAAAGRAAAADVLLPTALPPLPPSAPLALPEGFRLHEYRIDRMLGQGGFGITYLAHDVHLNARVAIKEYLPAEIAYRSSDKTVSVASSRHLDVYRFGLDSFLVEARTLATFRHPNIVRVARFFEAHQTAYMVLEYERGQPLSQWWPAQARMGEADLLALLQALLDGLQVVHRAGFLHRDIKPDNIHVRRADGSLVLLDFGSARQAVASAEQAHVVVTPGYAPIEQYENRRQGPWTDIYALGATLYWLVTGRRPEDAQQRLGAVDPLVPASQAARPGYSAAFLAAIDWALRPQPQDRPQDLDAWRKALFAAHASTLGLQEALRAGDPEQTRAPRSSAWSRLRAGLRGIVTPTAWPLALKMSLAMVATALLPMLSTAYYNLHGSLETVAASELRNLEQLARSTAGRIGQLVGDSRNLARSMGTDQDYLRFLARPTEAGKQAIRAKVEALVQANPDIHLIMVMDTAGTAVVSSDPEVMGRNFAFREYFRQAMLGREHMTGLIVGAVAGQAGMFYAQPVVDGQQRILGAVVLRIRESSFAAILDDVRQGSVREPFLVDGDGVVIQHADPRYLYRSLAPLSEATLTAIRADQRFRRDWIDDLDMPELARAMVGARRTGHITYTSPLSGQAEIAGYAPVPGHDWVVAIGETRAHFEAPLNQLFTHLLWSVGLVGLLFLGLSLRFARSVVRPIQALTAAAHALKAGDYTRAHVTVRSRDEIGQLARTFNVMIDVLRQRERERRQPGGQA